MTHTHTQRSLAVRARCCVKFDTDYGEKVWDGCGEVSKGLEGPKSHDNSGH